MELVVSHGIIKCIAHISINLIPLIWFYHK